MLLLPTYTKQPWTESYSEIIDVRSPSEFAEDHIPGAINLPVLNDAERAEVGTIYKQVSPFNAQKIGAAFVSKNIYLHLNQHFATKDKNYHPLVYCWRGRQRSLSMALVLAQIGWRVKLVEGGYKTYRAYVRHQMEHLPEKFTYQVLRGLAGSGKTRILRQMRLTRNAQVLDLEALANYRGSLLGQEWESKPLNQPSQKLFESLLLQQLQRFNPHQPVWVESESNKIGQIYLPESLWKKMKQASCVEIRIPIAARVHFLLQEYPYLMDNPTLLKLKLEKLKSSCGWDKLIEWYQLIDAGKWEEFVQDILYCHYDPTYLQSMKRYFTKVELLLSIRDLSDSSIDNFLATLFPHVLAAKSGK
jgi:tRNA 2-selenouridine synthase